MQLRVGGGSARVPKMRESSALSWTGHRQWVLLLTTCAARGERVGSPDRVAR
jgi:hypothetical protein